MQELEPSPVEETPAEIPENGGYFPLDKKSGEAQLDPSTPPNRYSSLLGLSGHSTTWWLTRIQRYSSYTFTAFMTMHITNTSLIPLATRSVAASDTYLLLTRPYYQSPLMEPLLIIIPAIAHVASGLALRLYRRRQSVLRYGAESKADRDQIPWPKVSGISKLGYVLQPLLLAHVFVNRLLPLLEEGGSSGVGLQYVAHGFAKHPALSFATYIGLVGVGTAHVTWGFAKYFGWTPEQSTGEDGSDRDLQKKRRWYTINGIAATLAAVWMAGGLGVIGRGGPAAGWVGRGFDQLYRKIPIVGRWM
ncbi:hypothetical protein MMC25_002454 [Agyrium rufum]|nr:hypothetical protein [Agyrium rufum]